MYADAEITVNITNDAVIPVGISNSELNVFYQEGGELSIDAAIKYIKTGESEIQKYVDEVSKPEIDAYTNSVVYSATEQAKEDIEDYVTYTVNPKVDAYAEEVVKPYSDSASNSAGIASNMADIATEQSTIATNQANSALESSLNANNSANSALESANSAKEYKENTEVLLGEVTTLTEEVRVNAENAHISEVNAKASEDLAKSYKESAETAQNLAKQSELNAHTSENNAKTSEDNAEDYKDRCEYIFERLGTAIKIKGRVEKLEDLPMQGNLNGDAYLVGADGLDSYPEYYWYNDHWEFLGTSGGGGTWGTITGDITAQTDLQDALDSKQPTGDYATNTALTQGLATKQDIISDLDTIRENASLVSTKQDIISDLETIRSNAQDGKNIIPQVNVNTQRIEDLTTAKFPNVVIVGTPHIEGGQVSNYSDTSYLQFPFVDISRGQPFDIYFSFTTAQDVTTQQNILDAYFGIALAIQNGKGIMALSSNGTSWDIGTSVGTNALLPNTTYYVKYSWTGTEYSAALSTDDQTYVPDMNLASTLSPHKTTIFIGGSPNIFGAGSAHPFKGTINFNKSKVVVNGITVWEGMADVGLASRANVSLNNLDEVGEGRFNAKQDVITDLATIRDGASKGATALQTIPIARANVVGGVAGGNWLTVNQSTGKMECGELTKAQYDSANGYTFIGKTTLENVLTPRLDSKQDTLVSGTNIDITNNTISAKDVVNYNNITNCITEIPQDIKLELNNGTLILKAGSKLYVPNGAGKFDVVTISSDLTRNTNVGGIIFVNAAGTSLYTNSLNKTYSGASAPSVSGVWFDTENYLIKYSSNGQSWTGQYSLPIAIVTDNGSIITSIDQVFNGFGYIGSTVFALPGVKGLIPNGRNTDGSLKNIEWTNNSVKIITSTLDGVNHVVIGNTQEFDNYINLSDFQGIFNTPPPVSGNCGSYYNDNENIMYISYGNQWNKTNRLLCGGVSVLSNKITSFTPKTPFHALDYNDKSTISGWGMPSGRYIDLTLGASGSTYTAPANGWFCVAKRSGGTNQYLGLISFGLEVTVYYDSNLIARNFMPCKKGGTITVNYNMSGDTQYFRFIYAEGE